MKKKLLYLGILLVLTASSCSENFNDELVVDKGIKKSTPELVKLNGFDEWGFNWQAQHFNGYLINAMLGDHFFIGWPHYKQYVYNGEGEDFWEMLILKYDYFPFLMPESLLDSRVSMHWNSGLISKDGIYPGSWVDTDAWITFKYSGKTGNKTWSHFRKLAASKSTDQLIDGIWYNEDGKEIGFESLYWPELIVIQVINNGDIPPVFYEDYRSPWGPGFGKYKVTK